MLIFEVVFPIFLIILGGYLARRHKIVRETWVHVLNSFVYYVSLPALILVGFWEINWTETSVLKALGFNVLVLLSFGLLLLLVLSFTKLKAKTKAAIFLTAVVGNSIYMGFPLIGRAVSAGDYKLVVSAGAIHLVVGLVFSALVIEFLVVKSKKWKIYARDFFKNPLIASLFLGIIFSLINFKGPLAEMIKAPIFMLGATASPLALFALGGFLHGRFLSAHLNLALLSSALKLLIFPIFALILGSWLKLEPSTLGISALLVCMPTAVTAFVIAEQYGLDESLVANSILISTAASVGTISMFLLGLLA